MLKVKIVEFKVRSIIRNYYFIKVRKLEIIMTKQMVIIENYNITEYITKIVE